MQLFSNFSLTEEEIDELTQSTVFEELEIEFLYNRFIYLDRSNSGHLTHTDLQFIPEFDANPFNLLIINYLEKKSEYQQINFAKFLQFLGIFSERSEMAERISFYFNIFDFNRSGKLTKQVVASIYELIMPGGLDYKEIKKVFTLYDRNNKGYLSKGDFTRLYKDDPSIEKNSIIDFKRTFGEIKRMSLWDILWPSGNKL